MIPRVTLLLTCAAALAAAGCGEPDWAVRDGDLMSETRRMAEKLQKDVYIPPSGSTGRRGRTFVKIAAIDLSEGPEDAKRLDFGRRPKHARLAWGLRGVLVSSGWLEEFAKGLPQGAVSSKTFVLSGGAPGLLKPPGGGEASAFTFTAGIEGARPVLTFRSAGVVLSEATPDLRLAVPSGGAVVLVPPRKGAEGEGMAAGLLSALTGAPAHALVIEARQMR